MNVKKNTLIALLLTCLMAGSIISAYADDFRPHLQMTTANTSFAAGSKGSISITLRNDGNFDATEVEAILSSTTAGVTPLSGAQKVLNKVGTGQSVTYKVDIIVDQSVATGAYVLTLTMNYLRGGFGIVTVSVPISIVVNQPSLPSMKITAFNSKIIPGSVNEINLTAQNIAATNISDIDITLSSATSLVSIGDSVNHHLTALNAGDSVSFNTSVVVLENTPIGAYALTAQVWYVNSYGVTMKQTIIIPLEVTEIAVTRSPVVTVKNLAPRMVLPGEAFSISLEASCAGAPVYNARAVLSQDVSGLVSPMTQTTVSLGDISAGGNARFSFDLLMSGTASARDIPLTVSIKYVDAKGVPGTATEVVTIPVEEIVDFGLMQNATVTAEKGKTTTFEADLLLVGTGRVEFTKIEVQPEGPIVSVSGSAEYIGAVDPDSPVPFTLKFAVANNTANGANTLKLKVSYLDNRNVPQSQTVSVRLNVVDPVATAPTQANDGGIWGWLRRIFGLQ